MLVRVQKKHANTDTSAKNCKVGTNQKKSLRVGERAQQLRAALTGMVMMYIHMQENTHTHTHKNEYILEKKKKNKVYIIHPGQTQQ